jgi:radical SAM-linked protein
MSLAAPLALGVTSGAELMDIVLAGFVSPHAFTDSVGRQLPRGIAIDGVFNTALLMPALQSQLRFAEYTVALSTDQTRPDIEAAIAGLLKKDSLPWQHQRDTGPHKYDLRALVDDLWLIDWSEGACRIGMRLRCDTSGSGRPEQVAAALGFFRYPDSIHRTRLILRTS